MRIVHVTHSLDPMKGGTSVAVKSLAEGCAALGVASPVISLDPPDAPWLEDWQVPVMGAGPAHTHFGWTPRLKFLLRRHVRGASVVVVHGLWQYHNVAVLRACREMNVPFIVYPHGMMDPWALRQSRIMKLIGWKLVVAPLLHQASGICFTTESEQTASAKAWRNIPLPSLILPLGVEGPPDEVATLRAEFFDRQPELLGKRILLFVGRLHPKKGVDTLIKAFARWRSSLTEEQQSRWHLRLTGPPDSEAYLKELSDLLKFHQLNLGVDVTMPGMVPGRLRWQEFAGCEAFILPSHQENFGIVVGEALACSKPALISDKVNTWPWVVEASAGFSASDTLEGACQMLQDWNRLASADQEAMCGRAKELFRMKFAVPARCKEFVDAIRGLLSARVTGGIDSVVSKSSGASSAHGERHLKVLHVIPSLSPVSGGPYAALLNMAKELANIGMEVDIIATNDDGRNKRHLDAPLGRWQQRDHYRFMMFSKQSEMYKISFPLLQWLKHHVTEYDIVHVHALFSFPSIAGARVARSQGVPYIIRPLGVMNRWGLKNRRPWPKLLSYSLNEQVLLRDASAIHCTSKEEANELAGLGFRWNTVLVPLGLDLTQFQSLPSADIFYERFPEARHTRNILFLSRVNAKKGLDLLLPAFARLHAHDPGLRLILAGDEGDAPCGLTAKLHQQAVALGIAGNVTFTGFITGEFRLACLAAACLFVLPSYSENFGISLLEALAAGLPCIASDQVALAVSAARSRAVCLVPCQEEALRQAIRGLLDDPAEAARLAFIGKAFAHENYSLSGMGRSLLALYQNVTA